MVLSLERKRKVRKFNSVLYYDGWFRLGGCYLYLVGMRYEIFFDFLSG